MTKFANALQRNVTPFRFDMVGSFLRPARLKAARAEFAAGKLSAEGLKQAEDEAIADLVQKQKAVGLRAVTDGEFRRSWWHLDFMWGLNGVDKATLEHGYRFSSEETRPETARLSAKITGDHHPFVEHFKFVRQLAGGGVIARQTIPAPSQFLLEIQRPENKAATERIYGDADELLADIAGAYRTIIADLYAAGCRSLQFDDVTWAGFCDAKLWQMYQSGNQNLRELLERNLRLNNLALEHRPKDLVVTTHVCRGNYHSDWAYSGGYEPVAEILFGRENVAAFYLEYDTDRAGDFAPLRFLSDGKQAVLGLFSSKTGQLEDRAVILRRVEEATQYLDINRICLSPQCGFASTEEGNILTEEQQWSKLAFIKEIADEIWK